MSFYCVCMTYKQEQVDTVNWHNGGRPTVYIPHELAEIRVVAETLCLEVPRTRRSSRCVDRASRQRAPSLTARLRTSGVRLLQPSRLCVAKSNKTDRITSLTMHLI